jgi:hypothetical protein
MKSKWVEKVEGITPHWENDTDKVDIEPHLGKGLKDSTKHFSFQSVFNSFVLIFLSET